MTKFCHITSAHCLFQLLLCITDSFYMYIEVVWYLYIALVNAFIESGNDFL